jgi:energy-coupling factor transporter ATP-binding protein EcfA2
MPSDNRLARWANEAPRIPWQTFITQSFKWRAGEHIGLVGPTGQGKTTMILNLLPLHPYVTVFATKPRDRTMDGLIATGYLRMERWRSIDPEEFPRRVLWPNAVALDSAKIQHDVFKEAFAKIYREGNWTVALDETMYMSSILKLDDEIKTYLLQARSLDISLVSATQRPAWVPRELYTSCTHLFFWRVNDETDLRSLGGIGSRSSDLIRDVVANLESYQALYINTRTGEMIRTRCPEVKIPTVINKRKVFK